MRILKLLLLLFLFCTLLSCEGAYDLSGHVFDITTKRSITGVQVILVLGKKDTIWKCKPPVPYELNRGKYQLAFTDIAGNFSISSGLIGMGSGDAKVIFTKKGYFPVIIPVDGIKKFDSVQMQQLQ
jgi:hypothetical protein